MSRLAFCIILALGLSSHASAAENYPNRLVRIVVPFAAGSGTDVYARLLANHLQAAFGQSFVIENKVGALGTVAAEAVARSNPDGYTLFFTTATTQSAAAGLRKNLRYDPLKDFTAIARLGNIPSVLVVNQSLPVKSLQELIAYAKENPGKVSYATGNSTAVITGAALQQRAQIDVVHVPYNSAPQAWSDVLGGRVPVMISDTVTAMPQIRVNAVRALAVPSRGRYKLLPDVPSIAECCFPDFELIAWLGLLGPSGLPQPIVKRLSEEVAKFMEIREVNDRLTELGLEPFTTSTEEFDRFIRDEYVKWMRVIKDAGIEPQ